MNFNQSAFQASQAYQVKDEVAKNMQGYRDFKQQEEEARKLEKEMEELENRPWYEKAWDVTKTFTGEITGYYDSVRATTGVDPVTGRKLSEAERIAAGAMAAAGFIPIVGWAGRAVKGGSAIYKTAKTMNAAEHAMSAYKTADSMKWMAQAEKGLYGLTSANEANAYLTGKDLLGNEYSGGEQGFTLAGIIGLGSVMKNGNIIQKSKKYNVEKKPRNNTIEGPYSNLKDSKYVGVGKDFTATQKKKIIEENRKRNDGLVKSDLSGEIATKPQKSQKGVTPVPNEWQIDHIVPKDKGGSNSYRNAQVLTRKENREKSNKLPSEFIDIDKKVTKPKRGVTNGNDLE